MRARGENYALTPGAGPGARAALGPHRRDLRRRPIPGRTDGGGGGARFAGRQPGGTEAAGSIKQHVLATAKHFAAHGQPEGGRNSAPANFSEGELRENYLKAFQAAVTEAGVGSVMASYNEINGIPVHTNPWLLEQVLRAGMGLPGLARLGRQRHQPVGKLSTTWLPPKPRRPARRSGSGSTSSWIPVTPPPCWRQVQAGSIPEAWVEQAAGRVLSGQIPAGPVRRTRMSDPAEAERVTNCAEHRQLAYLAATKSLVLLKNDGLLPLELGRIKTLAVIGPNAAGLHLGGYSADPGHGAEHPGWDPPESWRTCAGAVCRRLQDHATGFRRAGLAGLARERVGPARPG